MPVGVEHPAGPRSAPRLHEVAAHGDDDDARPRMHRHPPEPGRREEADLPRPHPHAGGQDHRADRKVSGPTADVRPRRHGAAHVHDGVPAIGPRKGDHGVRSERDRRTGGDAERAGRDDPFRVPGARLDLGEHAQSHDAVGGEVIAAHRVAFAGGDVRGGQVVGGDHVPGEDAAHGVVQDHVEGRHRPYEVEAGGQAVVDGPHGGPRLARLADDARTWTHPRRFATLVS